MEYHSANLDTLPTNFTLRLRIYKSRMRDSTCPPIRLRVKTFNHRHQIRRLPVAIVPLNTRIWSDTKSLAFTVWIDQLDADKVTFVNSASVSDGKWILENCPNRSPHVDDLVPTLQKLRSVIGEMVADTVLGRLVGLIDMDALDWTAEIVCGRVIFCRTTDGVVEDEDS